MRCRVIQGFVEVGDQLVVLPVGDTVRVSKLEHLQAPSDGIDDPKRLSIAVAGDTVQLVINDIDIIRFILMHNYYYPHFRNSHLYS